MRNPKIYVTGASTEEMEKIKVLLTEKGIELVELPDDADATVDADWVLNRKVVLGNMPEVIDVTECCTEYDYDDGMQHWRGGSIGKGGKVKYRRN